MSPHTRMHGYGTRGPHPNDVTAEVRDWMIQCAVAFYLASARNRIRIFQYLNHMPLSLQTHVHEMVGYLYNNAEGINR